MAPVCPVAQEMPLYKASMSKEFCKIRNIDILIPKWCKYPFLDSKVHLWVKPDFTLKLMKKLPGDKRRITIKKFLTKLCRHSSSPFHMGCLVVVKTFKSIQISNDKKMGFLNNTLLCLCFYLKRSIIYGALLDYNKLGLDLPE